MGACFAVGVTLCVMGCTWGDIEDPTCFTQPSDEVVEEEIGMIF